MEIHNYIIEKVKVSKFLFEQFNRALNVSSIINYCLQDLPRKGEFEDCDNEKVKFHIHGSDIDFVCKGQKVICDRTNYKYFNAYSLSIFIKNISMIDVDVLEYIQDCLDALEKDNKIKKAIEREWYYIID